MISPTARLSVRCAISWFSSVLLTNAAAAAEQPLVIVRSHEQKAVVVVPADASRVVLYAAEELQYHIRKASGARLEVIRERPDTARQPAIFLGPTRRAQEAGIDPSKLEANGFVIRRHESALLMIGHDGDGDAVGRHAFSTRAGTLFAVYEFLETHLGVRWLWPGPLGEFIPLHPDIVVREWNQTEGYRYEWADLRVSTGEDAKGWSSEKAKADFIRAQDVWLRRQRLSQLNNIRPSHNFEGYWRRFGDKHPEYFARLPNGERRPLTGDSGIRITMCVSQPALWNQIVQDWVDSGQAQRGGVIKIGENDSAGSCTCEGCRAWDAPDGRFRESRYWSGEVSERELDRANRFKLPGADPKAPSLSDRYARFYLAVQKTAEKVRPEARVAGFVYANYSEPPKVTKLNERVILSLVPGMGEGLFFPWTQEKREGFRKQWAGWFDSGARLILRPNSTIAGHNMPLFYAQELGEDVGYALRQGAIATDFDNLGGAWGVQGPTLYVLGRIHVRPELPVEKILAEYYQAFGRAQAQVQRYFKHWEAVSQAITQEQFDSVVKATGAHRFRDWVVLAPHFWTDEVMAKGRALLAAAKTAARGDPVIEERVEYLAKGLRHAELTLGVQKAHNAYRGSSGEENLERCREALRSLERYRKESEGDFIDNLGSRTSRERVAWDRAIYSPSR